MAGLSNLLGSIDAAALWRVSPDATFVVGVDGRLSCANPAAEELLGFEIQDFIGRSVLDLVHPDDAMLVWSSVDAVQGKRVGTPIEIRLLDSAGKWRWLEVVGRDCLDVPEIAGIVCTARDLTQRRMWEVAAGDVVRFQQVVQHAPAIVLLLDPKGVVASVNGAFTRILGHDPSAVVGRRLADFAGPGHERSIADAIATTSASRMVGVECPMRSARAAAAVPVRLEIVNLVEDPVIAGYVVTGHDVSVLHEAKSRLEYMASHDSLTGLLNRSTLDERLRDLLAISQPLAVLYIDLDNFKPVNDLHGHDVGDELLRCAANRLTGAVDANDLVARVGGDEFVLIALGVTERSRALVLADRLRAVFAQPFGLTEWTVRVGASVGTAVATQGSTVAGLMAEADRSMYANKSTSG